ncbi:DegT/DnrJ/EryC1/StrS family aminotransferase [Paractinoplanes atraurantiacus]|uniref:dTDP-4-amino-4,6-dideoxygalactose transaminase n=1 Tax=Paractinoplanes atraurantiacus TaxID=1036182 RepID=A0A285IZU2_9ACTN|nr:DegT/DnrJ/EryC1/StrS family aminotransferase [Actinoplanes atraurantiacus]SNY53580.1 dTDP-4-amino-4,6-dideoxygalactose transaminase [Actinoplanes atraurantiacus]
MSLEKRLGLRMLPFGANYLDWSDMTELQEAIDNRILFRYQTETESAASRLERVVAQRLGAGHVLAVHNCTEALRLALISTRPAVGDLVYIPALTFVAVAGAVLSCGLIPVPVDVDDRLMLDTTLIPAGAQRVILAHMEGSVADVPASVPYVIEDTAQALGATFPDGRHAGTVGYAGTFSFHHAKVLTSGEGGLLTTNDERTWETMRSYHDHGSIRIPGRYPIWGDDAFYGENFVTSEGTAAVQLQQFRHLDEILAGLARHYAMAAAEAPERPDLTVLPRREGEVKLSVRISFESPELRDRAVKAVTEAGISSWTLDKYDLPAHPVLSGRRSLYAEGFPWNLADPGTSAPISRDGFRTTRDRISRILCLPMSPELSEADQREQATYLGTVLRKL